MPPYLTSTRIAAVGDGALVIDADSGVLALVDAAGATIGQLAIAHDAGLFAYDPTARLAYVADRRGDRIAVVRVGSKLALVTAWKTPAEPYGVALLPDRTTALVTRVADRLVLLGIAASAPYFHDGSAATLDAVLRDRGAIHGMSEPGRTLGAAEAADLIAFLESL